jgi:CelD/BcsL family acetyltransferase involved in cellulose biosynthesis
MDYRLHTTFPDELEGEWNALLEESIAHVPFLRHEYLLTWWQTRGGGEWGENAMLAIVTARQNGRLVGIAPLFHAVHQSRPELLLLGSIEISDYLDFICRPADLPAFLEGLLSFLRSAPLPAWQALDLYNVLESSPTLKELERIANQVGWQYEAICCYHAPCIPLPGDWETYLAGIDKKQRHEIRRKMRRAEEADGVRWYIVSDPAALEDEITAFMDLMAQDEDKMRFLTPAMREQMRLATRCAFENGCLLLAFLEVEGAKAAAYLCFDYLNRLWVYNSGFDRRFMEFSPGWVLLGNLLRWSNEQKRSEFDFMRGDEEYKYRFGAVDRWVMRVTVTSPAS